jgi:hypothetical protein
MVGSLFAALLFVAPEAPPPADAAPAPTTTEAPATPDASTRDYQGPTAVQAPESDTGPALIGTSEPVAKPEDKGPATLTATTATPTDPTLGFPVEHRRMTPRALETIEKFADDEVAVVQKRRVKFYPGIQVRNQVGYVSPFTIDRFGNEYAEGGFSTGRIRWNPVLEIRKKIKLVGMLDLVNGRWAPSGSEDPIIDEIIERGKPPGRTTLPIADPRELYLEWRFGLGLLRVGQQAFTWGQGILANNGNYQDRRPG